MAKGPLERLLALEGAMKEEYSPYNYLIRSPSPSWNFTYAGGHPGIAEGYTAIYFGPPEGGKSLGSLLTIGQLHRDDPEAYAVYANTELRAHLQITPKMKRLCGIDPKRLIVWDVNQPEQIFDRFENEVAAAVDDGLKIKLAVIDSLQGIQGRRALNAESVSVQQIGDHAATVQEGLKRIVSVQRDKKISVILTAHVRAEMDLQQAMKSQKSGGQAVKMASGWGVKHEAEYFVYIERDETADGKKDLLDRPFINENVTDVRDKGGGELFAHKHRVIMKKSSCGARGRMGTFTWHYQKGLINVHEEVFLLGTGRGIIERPNNTTYVYGGKQWRGKPAMLAELEKDTDLQAEIVKELTRRDLEGQWEADEAPADPALETLTVA